MPIEITRTDITQLHVDAIVNAANQKLLGGGGVDGAIHRAAGPRLKEACRQIEEVRPGVRCPTGQARITPAFNLPARFVIHAVGPVWSWGGKAESLTDEAKAEKERLLRSCYRQSLELAAENACTSIAFPAISCGIYGYPVEAACRAALDEIAPFLDSRIERVVLSCFARQVYEVYEALL
jgi:O-acetyl-ADP-ribose deacetylase (regulator of RNase III)